MSLAKNITASNAIATGVCAMRGFYVNSTSSGTLVVRDGGASGTAKSGTITPAVGWHDFPAQCMTGLYITVGGTLDVTIFWD